MKLFVPGRICLVGEHSDWAGGYRRINAEIEKGYAIICGTNQGIYAEVEPHPTALVINAVTPTGETQGPYEIPMKPHTLLEEAQKGEFWSYLAGVAYQVMTHYHVRGLVINNYKTDLPIKKGLSSSAAICVLTARAFNRIYDLKLTTRGEMELAYQGEITTPSRCGRMDQGCAFGSRPVLMTFDGDRLDTHEFQVHTDHHFVIVDLQGQKNTMEILNRLNRCFPVADNEAERGVQKLLGPTNKGIVHRAMEELASGTPEQVGSLLAEAQTQFDRYAAPVCPEELTAPLLHKVLELPAIQPHIWGGKGVGSQGDGTAQLLARSAADQDKVIEIIGRELNMPGLKLTLTTGSKVRKAVIPAAGFGTRLFPASKAAKKEFFPVVDRDGVAKPAMLIIVEEAIEAGIEEIIIIVQPGDLEQFQSFFNTQISMENFNKLPTESRRYAEKLLDIGKRVSFVTQNNQEGFGHAVYCARQLVGDEPFLLMLGDHIYRAAEGHVSCARQLVDAYTGNSLIGLRRTPEDKVKNFGTIAGVWLEDEGQKLVNVTAVAEKPSPEYASEHLRIPGLPEGEYLTVFGQYILQPEVFEYLEENITHNLRERGEFQLSTVLDRLRQYDGLHGLMIEGDRFDIGIPDYYLDTLARFRQGE